jgi:hypothetical protein
MVINGPVCQELDSCFASVISFKGNIMTIDPWVDNSFSARYMLDDEGKVAMYGNGDTLWLIPHYNCITTKAYFDKKTRTYTSDFHLTDTFNSSTGVARFPSAFDNELIIGKSADTVFYILNDQILHQSLDGRFEIVDGAGETIWVHVDKRLSLAAVAPILSELFVKGFNIQYSVLESNENDEQVIILERTITQINKYNDRIEIETCDHCEKYPLEFPDRIVRVKMLGADSFVLNGDTNDLFQTRNALVRYLGQDRTSRLRTEIQIEISKNTSFSDYLTLVDEFLWIHIEVSSITFYNGKNDPDAAWIRKKQEDTKTHDLKNEFPIRVREIIK